MSNSNNNNFNKLTVVLVSLFTISTHSLAGKQTTEIPEYEIPDRGEFQGDFNGFLTPKFTPRKSCADNMKASNIQFGGINNGNNLTYYTCAFKSGWCSPSSDSCPERFCSPTYSDWIGPWNNSYRPLDVAWFYTCVRVAN